jgi:tetratricopeptide (TPR) repeat protein
MGSKVLMLRHGRLMWRRGALLLAAIALLAGCAARQPSAHLRMDLMDLNHADTLLEAGCHQCLQEALATYTSVAGRKNAPLAAATGAFRAAVLLTLRAKELGMPAEPALAVAQRWAAAQRPVSEPGRLLPTVYLDALALVDGEVSGLVPEERERRNGARRAAWPSVDGQFPASRAALTPVLATDVLAQYLALAIDCEDARARKQINHTEVLSRYPQPLMHFRVALCGVPGVRMDPLRQADSRWLDTLFFEGRFEMSRFPSPDVGRAAGLFESARAAFPTSDAITLALGHAKNALEAFGEALAAFDSVLTIQPTHREALLGRLLSLSYMRRHYDAIRTATQMITLGTYHIGDAYYWRAWNRYQVHDLPNAWTDVEAAGKLMVNTAVYTLAGFIAYAQRELDIAIDRLDGAYRMDNTNCEAVWTEGMVHVDKEAWEQSSDRFTTAAGCFAADARTARETIVTTRSAAWTEADKTRRIASAQKRADSSDHRQAQSAFNAASSYLRLGKKTEALGYADLAAQHPLLKEKAAALRATIEKLP